MQTNGNPPKNSVAMADSYTIAIDAMGGDHGPSITVRAAALALRENPDLSFILCGDEKQIAPLIDANPALRDRCKIVHTDKVVSGDEKPSAALRSGKTSSMGLAIQSVKNGEAAGIVSAGNTGALMAMAKLALRCLPGIDRPAIASVLPSKKGDTVMLDLGANVECGAEMLVQFAVLGAVYARAVRGIAKPSVGILNVGTEEGKGHDEVRNAAAILSKVDFPGRFAGFVEGNDIAAGTVDVVVTDGFTGNVALKVAEGVGSLAAFFVREAFTAGPWSMISAIAARGALKRLRHRVDPRQYNGGMFLGLEGICVKSHGSMDAYAFSQAILLAARLIANRYNERVAAEIRDVLGQEAKIGLAQAGLP